MIDPQQCADRIVHPQRSFDVAKELFDLLLWAAEQSDLKDNSDYDEIMSDLYKRLPAGRDSREAYAKTRLQRTDLQAVNRVECAGAGSN